MGVIEVYDKFDALVSNTFKTVPFQKQHLIYFAQEGHWARDSSGLPIYVESYDENELTGIGGQVSHEALAQKLKKWSSWFISAETPVYMFRNDRLLTGHIDILLGSDDFIYVCDYKPDLKFKVGRDISQNFINAVPQVAAYALVLKEKYGANVKCVIFNQEGAWVFDPEVVLKDITRFMHDQHLTTCLFDGLPWEPYFFYHT